MTGWPGDPRLQSRPTRCPRTANLRVALIFDAGQVTLGEWADVVHIDHSQCLEKQVHRRVIHATLVVANSDSEVCQIPSGWLDILPFDLHSRRTKKPVPGSILFGLNINLLNRCFKCHAVDRLDRELQRFFVPRAKRRIQNSNIFECHLTYPFQPVLWGPCVTRIARDFRHAYSLYQRLLFGIITFRDPARLRRSAVLLQY